MYACGHFGEGEVHSVAGMIVIISPAKARTVEGKFIQQVIDDCSRDIIILGAMAPVICEVIILPAVFLLNAVIDEMVLNLGEYKLAVGERIHIGVHRGIQVNGGSEGMMAHESPIRNKAGVQYAVEASNEARKLYYAAVIPPSDMDIGAVHIAYGVFEIRCRLLMDVPSLARRGGY